MPEEFLPSTLEGETRKEKLELEWNAEKSLLENQWKTIIVHGLCTSFLR